MATGLDRLVLRDGDEPEDDWQMVGSDGQPDAAEPESLYDHIRSSSDHPTTGAPLASAADPDSSRSSFTWRVVARQGASAGSFEDVEDGLQMLTPAPTTTRTVNPSFSPGSTTTLAVAADSGALGGSAAPSAVFMPVSIADGGRSPAPGSNQDDGSYTAETSSMSQSLKHCTRPHLVPATCSASVQAAAADEVGLHPPSTYSSDTWDLVIISKPSTFRPVAHRPSRHFIFQLPVLNLLFPGMLCILTAHHMLCGSRNQHPHTFGSFPSFSSRHPCSDGLCLSS